MILRSSIPCVSLIFKVCTTLSLQPPFKLLIEKAFILKLPLTGNDIAVLAAWALPMITSGELEVHK
jgi:hypothetical protein